jgi:pimeloyl-ACP methyl ester carboxylesterase
MPRPRTAPLVLALLCVLSAAAPFAAQQPAAAPTVVFIAGLGDDARVWRKTIRKLGDSIRVVAYDRPGYGARPAGDAPRDPCTVASELHAQLRATGQAPPYVLVGHSLGGQYAYAYSRLFPDDVAGLVLVDATPIGHWAAMQRELPAAARVLRLLKSVTFSGTMKREFDAQEQCLDSLPAAAVAFPVRVLMRTVGDPVGGAQLLRLDTQLAAGWLRLTGATQLEPVPGAGHYIQKERPELLAEVIRQAWAPR